MSYDVVADSVHQPSELHPYLAGSVIALNAFLHGDSASRSMMFTSHKGQDVVIENPSIRKNKTGAEFEYAKHTVAIKAPCDMKVVARFERYSQTLGMGSISQNPETIIIYQNQNNYTYDYLLIPRYHTRNHHLGFKYVQHVENQRRLVVGQLIREGTIFASSPNVTADGDYKYAKEVNVAFMSIPEVEQDGMVVTEDFVNAYATTHIDSRTAQWGTSMERGNSTMEILINLYGDENNYKPFPDIGDKIRDDGLLFATRKVKSGVGCLNLTKKALREFDPLTDKPIFADAGAIVTNVVVESDRLRSRKTVYNFTDPAADKEARDKVAFYDTQADKYERAGKGFSHRIHEWYMKLKLELKRQTHANTLSEVLVPMSSKLTELVRDAIADLGGDNRSGPDRTQRGYKKVPIGDWRAEITYVKRIVPGVRFKISDSHGGKGVIVKVIRNEDAPVDKYGRRADVIMDDVSIIKRMNMGKPTEQYINFGHDWEIMLLKEIIVKDGYLAAWEHLLGYYKSIAWEYSETIQQDLINDDMRISHVKHIMEANFIDVIMPLNRRHYGAEQIRRLIRYNNPQATPVRYRGASGNLVWTKSPVVIGSLYIMMLEKMGDWWSSVSLAKLSHFGTPAEISPADKFATPWRPQPIKSTGEAEVRLFYAGMGGQVTARLLNFSNTPAMQREAARIHLTSDKPFHIKSIIDEKLTPLGQSRPLTMYKHIQECSGKGFFQEPSNKKEK